VVEAMAAGFPSVASDIEAHREIINHGRTGFLAADPASMAGVVETLSDDQGLRDDIAARARAYVREHYSSEACARRYLDLYRSLAGS